MTTDFLLPFEHVRTAFPYWCFSRDEHTVTNVSIDCDTLVRLQS